MSLLRSPCLTAIHNSGVQPLLLALVVSSILYASAASNAETVLVKMTEVQLQRSGVTLAAAHAPAKDAGHTGSTLHLTGRVAIPNRGMEVISATVPGQVQEILINVGDTVRPGTPLVRIYSGELLGLQRQYLQARSAMELSSQKLQRDEALFNDGIIAASRVHESRSADAQAQAALQEQKQLLKLAGMHDAAIGKLITAANINPIQVITATLTGVVLEQNATPGSRVEPGAALFKLANIQTLWVELQATQSQVDQLRIGNEAIVKGCSRNGKVIAISPQLSRDSQTALVRAEFANADRCLKPNQFAAVDLQSSGDAQHLVSIPAKALLRGGGKDYVFVKTQGGFQQQQVSVQGRQQTGQGEQAWVSDLPEGTQVAVSGIAALRGAANGLGSEE